jgi:hypothetical protein
MTLKIFLIGSFCILGYEAEAATPTVTPAMAISSRAQCMNDNGKACYVYAVYLCDNTDLLRECRMFLERGCRLNNTDSCEEIKKDDKIGESFRRKCAAGDAYFCVVYASGMNIIFNEPLTAYRYANKACWLGSKSGCEYVEKHKVEIKINR